MAEVYRVEKGGRSFHVQAYQLGFYEQDGWDIYKVVEEQVTDVAAEMEAYDNSETATVTGGESNEA